MEASCVDDWKAYDPNNEFPSGLIYCPLDDDALKQAYSMPSLVKMNSSLEINKYMAQMEAYKVEMGHPSLHQHPCAPSDIQQLETTTIASYSRTIDEFVGFCLLHLDVDPSIELIMFPQLIAKYMGFHLARGNSPSTLNKIARQMMRGVWFAISYECPNKTYTFTSDAINEVVRWLTSLEHDTHHAIPIHPKFITNGTTLYHLWQSIDTKWDTFKSNFEVRKVHREACSYVIWLYAFEGAMAMEVDA